MISAAVLAMAGQLLPLHAQQTETPLPVLSAEQHPFLEWGGEYPRWSRLTPQQRLEAICRLQPHETSWENTFAEFDALDVELAYADQLLSNLTYLMDSPEVRAAMEEVTPEMAEFSSSITSNERLWSVIRQASTQPWVRQLSPARQRFVQEVVDSFKDSGADLPADKKARKLEISKEMAALRLQFDKNCKDSTSA